MSNSQATIATMVAKLGFEVDTAGLVAFEKKLKLLQADMAAMGKQAQAGLSAATGSSKQLQHQYAKGMALQQKAQRGEILGQKLSAETFKAKLQESKLTLSNQRSSLVLQHEQNRAAVSAIRITEAQSRANIVAQRFAQAKLRTEALQLRMKKAAASSRLSSLPAAIRTAGNGATAVIGGVSGGGVGGVMGVLGGLGPLGAAFAAVTAAAAAAGAALKGYADNVVEKGEAGINVSAKFGALDPANPQVGIEAEKRFRANANKRGDNADEAAPAYVKTLQGLTKAGFSLDQAEQTLNGIMDKAKAEGLTNDDLKNSLRGLLQSANSGKLQGDEWNQITDNLGGAASIAAAAWNKVNGGKALTTDKQKTAAGAKFLKDRENGKVSGTQYKVFMIEFAARVAADARIGGVLDKQAGSHLSNANRLQNIKDEQSRNEYAQADGEVQKARSDLDAALIELQKAFEPLGKLFASGGAGMLDQLTTSANYLAELVQWAAEIASLLNLDKTSIKAGTNDKERMRNIREFAKGEEVNKYTGERTPMDSSELRAAYVRQVEEIAKIKGDSSGIPAQQASWKLRNKSDEEVRQMLRDGVSQGEKALASRPAPVLPVTSKITNIPQPSWLAQARDSFSPQDGISLQRFSESLSEGIAAKVVDRALALSPAQQKISQSAPAITNTNTVHVGNITVQGGEGVDAEQLGRTIGDEFTRRLSEQLGAAGARMVSYD